MRVAVVKPLQKQLKGINVFAGATIMGDGKVALILDVLGLAQRANVISGVRGRVPPEKTTTADTLPKDTVLLFATRSGERMAIALSFVARLEEFPRSALERVGNRFVVQYRSQILPLLDVAKALGRKKKAASLGRGKQTSSAVQVVVYSGHGHTVGLIVGQILDIVEESIVTKSKARRRGVLFTAVVQEKVTEFLDVEGLVRAADSACLDPNPVEA